MHSAINRRADALKLVPTTIHASGVIYMTIGIVTDSTADIPLAEAEALGIIIVPLTVFFGEDAYLDGVELDNAGFYQKLQASKALPRTSQPAPAAFQEAYTRLIQEGTDGIL